MKKIRYGEIKIEKNTFLKFSSWKWTDTFAKLAPTINHMAIHKMNKKMKTTS